MNIPYWIAIEITSGVSSGPTRLECAGVVKLDFTDIGRRTFFVEAIDAEGGRNVLHDSYDYADAIITAEETASADGMPVRDFVVGETA